MENNEKQFKISEMFPSEINLDALKENKDCSITNSDYLNLSDILDSISKDVFKKDKTTYIDLNNPMNCIKPKEKLEAIPLFTTITPTISKNSTNETYFIKNKIVRNEYPSETKIRFREKFENGDIAAGITDEDLIWLLLYRNSDNDKRFNLLSKLLKTYC